MGRVRAHDSNIELGSSTITALDLGSPAVEGVLKAARTAAEKACC